MKHNRPEKRHLPLVTVLLLMILATMLLSCNDYKIGTIGTDKFETVAYVEPVNDATKSHVTIALPFQNGSIFALPPDTNHLFAAEQDIIGESEYTVSGTDIRTIELGEDLQNKFYNGNETLHWQIRLHPSIPLALNVNVSSGKMEADLQEFQLTDLHLNSSSGEINVQLPATEKAIYSSMIASSGSIQATAPDGAALDLSTVTVSSGQIVFTAGVNADFSVESLTASSGTIIVNLGDNPHMEMGTITISSGHVTFNLGENADFDVRITVSSGDLTFNVPDDAAVQINAEQVSSGKITLPEDYTKVESGRDDDEGVWESPTFAGAENQMILRLTLSSGEVEIN